MDTQSVAALYRQLGAEKVAAADYNVNKQKCANLPASATLTCASRGNVFHHHACTVAPLNCMLAFSGFRLCHSPARSSDLQIYPSSACTSVVSWSVRQTSWLLLLAFCEVVKESLVLVNVFSMVKG